MTLINPVRFTDFYYNSFTVCAIRLWNTSAEAIRQNHALNPLRDRVRDITHKFDCST